MSLAELLTVLKLLIDIQEDSEDSDDEEDEDPHEIAGDGFNQYGEID